MDILADQIHDHFERFWRALDSAPVSPALEKCAQEIRSGYAQNFANDGSPHFGAWPPRRDKLPHPLLRKKLRLYQAATQQGAEGNVTEIGAREASVGVESSPQLPYLGVQNFGWPAKNIPPRTFIDLSDQVLDKCDAHIADAVTEALP